MTGLDDFLSFFEACLLSGEQVFLITFVQKKSANFPYRRCFAHMFICNIFFVKHLLCLFTLTNVLENKSKKNFSYPKKEEKDFMSPGLFLIHSNDSGQTQWW